MPAYARAVAIQLDHLILPVVDRDQSIEFFTRILGCTYEGQREPFSFGGWNESKFGVGDITGRGSIEFWTQSKKMTTKWNREAGVNWMS